MPNESVEKDASNTSLLPIMAFLKN